MGQPSVSIVGPSGSITVGGDGGVDSEFQNSLKGKTDEQLKQMLEDGNLTPEQKQAVLDQLAANKKKELEKEGGPDATAESQEIDDLMRKLKNHTITDADKEKLAGLLGVDVKDLDKIANGTNDTQHVEIKGPSGTVST